MRIQINEGIMNEFMRMRKLEFHFKWKHERKGRNEYDPWEKWAMKRKKERKKTKQSSGPKLKNGRNNKLW